MVERGLIFDLEADKPAAIARQRARLPYKNAVAMGHIYRGLEAWIEWCLANRHSLVRIVGQWEENWKVDRSWYCDGSTLACFGPQNCLRQACDRILQTPAFATMVDITIFTCTISIGINCPLWFPMRSDGWWFFFVLDLAFSVFFTLELLVRLVANGLCCKPGAVLRTGWGRLDTIVVVSSWMALMEGLPDFKGGRAIRTLRVLRTLRSLRSLRLCKWFGTALDAIEIAMDGLLDVTVAAMFFLFLYAVLALPLFTGDLHQRCTQIGSDALLQPVQWCGRDWYGTEYSSIGTKCPRGFKCDQSGQMNHGYTGFDHIFVTMMTIFQCTTFEGWGTIMQAAQQSEGSWTWLYFLVLVFIFPLMIINLYVATIRASFSKARLADRSKEQSDPEPQADAKDPNLLNTAAAVADRYQHCLRVFNRFDLDGSGYIDSIDEMEQFISCLGFRLGLRQWQISELQISGAEAIRRGVEFTLNQFAEWLEGTLADWKLQSSLTQEASTKEEGVVIELKGQAEAKLDDGVEKSVAKKSDLVIELTGQAEGKPDDGVEKSVTKKSDLVIELTGQAEGKPDDGVEKSVAKKSDLDAKMRREHCAKVFERYDLDGTGYIDEQEEMEQMISSLAFRMNLKTEQLVVLQSAGKEAIVQHAQFTVDEFVDWLEKTLGLVSWKPLVVAADRQHRPAEQHQQGTEPEEESAEEVERRRQQCKRMFERYDLDGSGVIDSEEEMEQCLMNLAFALGVKEFAPQLQVAGKAAMCSSSLALPEFLEWFEDAFQKCRASGKPPRKVEDTEVCKKVDGAPDDPVLQVDAACHRMMLKKVDDDEFQKVDDNAVLVKAVPVLWADVENSTKGIVDCIYSNPLVHWKGHNNGFKHSLPEPRPLAPSTPEPEWFHTRVHQHTPPKSSESDLTGCSAAAATARYQHCSRIFERYDLDGSGFIDSEEEMEQYIMSLAFKVGMRKKQADELQKAGKKVIAEGTQLSLTQFVEWLEAALRQMQPFSEFEMRRTMSELSMCSGTSEREGNPDTMSSCEMNPEDQSSAELVLPSIDQEGHKMAPEEKMSSSGATGINAASSVDSDAENPTDHAPLIPAAPAEEMTSLSMLLVAMQRAKARKEKAKIDNLAAAQEAPKPWWYAALAWEFQPWACSKSIINHCVFDPLIMAVIMINSAFMAAPHQGMTQNFMDVLEVADLVFTSIFIVEFVLKLTGLGGFQAYFEEKMNIFDLSLLLLTFGSTLVTVTGLRGLRTIRVMRMMRSFRALRMLRVFAKVERLYIVFSGSGAAIVTQIIFIGYVMSTFALIGMQCFDQTTNSDQPLGRQNFDTFANALLTLFQVLTGEAWTEIMWGAAEIDHLLAIPYFVLYILLVNWTLTEMLIAVIVEKFEVSEEQRDLIQQQLVLGKQFVPKEGDKLNERTSLEASLQETMCNIKAKSMDEDETDNSQGKMRALDAFAHELISDHLKENQNSVGALTLKHWAAQTTGNKLAACFYGMHLSRMLDVNKAGRRKVEVQRSLCMFTVDNPFRQACCKIANHSGFEIFVFVAIMASCAFLAIDTPNKRTRLPHVDSLLLVADPILLGIFAFEFVIKVIANGFYGKKGAYWSDMTNRFDLLILILSTAALFLNEIGGLGRAFRVMRCIRPLRMISKLRSLKVVLISTIAILPETANVMLLFVFVTLLFATIALSLFLEGFSFCSFNDALDRDGCLGTFKVQGDDLSGYPVPAVWDLPTRNFKNIGVGLLTLIEVSSTELWPEVMFSAMDINGLDKQPIVNSEGSNALFFVFYLLLTRLVIFSLLVGIIIDQFNTTSGKGILTERQRNFKVISRAIFTEPKPQRVIVPDRDASPLRYFAMRAVSWEHWNELVLSLIVLNALLLALPYYGMTDTYRDSILIGGHILALLFSVELALRITAFGPRQFFLSAWNKFDTTVVIVMELGSVVSIFWEGSGLEAVGVCRLMLLARLVNRHAHSLRTILVTLLSSLAPLGSVMSMVLLVFFVYAVLGMTFFANVRHGVFLSAHYNFETFDRAMLTLLLMITGEDWNGIMHDCAIQEPECTAHTITDLHGVEHASDCGNPAAAYLFFVSFYFCGSFFLLSLFVAVISDCFETCNAMRAFGITQDVFDRFGMLWLERTQLSDPPYKWLHTHQLKLFLHELGEPLGAKDNEKYQRVHNQCLYMLGKKHQLPNGRDTCSVSYRKLLWLLVMESGDLNQIPFSERVVRTDELERIKALVTMNQYAAKWKGRKVRAAFEAHKAEVKRGGSSNMDSFWAVVHTNESSVEKPEPIMQNFPSRQSMHTFVANQSIVKDCNTGKVIIGETCNTTIYSQWHTPNMGALKDDDD